MLSPKNNLNGGTKMTLEQVLYEIHSKYGEVYMLLSDFTHLKEVESFLQRRKRDLEMFKELTACYSHSLDIIEVQQLLRERGVNPKFYGICMKRGMYFTITEKLQKAIEKYIEEFYGDF